MEILTIKDYPNHEVEIVKTGEVVLEMIRSKKVSNGEFLPANAKFQEKEVWNFSREKEAGFDGIGRLFKLEGEYFIILQDRKKRICKVISVNDLPKLQPISVGGKTIMIGGKSDMELYKLKLNIAEKLNLQVFVTSDEEMLNAEMVKFHQSQMELERVQREELRRAKEAAKTERVNSIMSREKIFAFSEDGKKCLGIPVVGNEWEMLPSDTPVILVDSLESRNPVEAFFVKKKTSGRLFKGSPKKVSAHKSSPETADPVIEAEGIIRVIKDGQLLQMPNFTTENFQRLRKTGLNSGTLVAVGQPDEEGRYTVIAMKGSVCETVGQFAIV